MLNLTIALAIASIGVGCAALFQWLIHRERKKRLDGLELRANCLLTRYPLVFLAGRRSVFRIFDHWNQVPQYLREHGYEVIVIEASPSRSPSSFIPVLKDLPYIFHLIADTSSYEVLHQIARRPLPNIASLTLVQNPKSAALNATPETFKPFALAIEIFEIVIPSTALIKNWKARLLHTLTTAHNRWFAGGERQVDNLETAGLLTHTPWLIESKFLELAVTLAERDTTTGDNRSAHV